MALDRRIKSPLPCLSMIVRSTAAAGVALVAVLAAGCSSSGGQPAPAPSSRSESATHLYLRLARKYADPRVPDHTLLLLGRGVCQDFAAGRPWVALVGTLTRNHAMSGFTAGALIATATGVFCPQFKSRLPNS